MDVIAVLLDDVVHRRRIPVRSFRRLLFAEINTKFVLVSRSAALLIDGPCIGFVAAANDAVVADNVELVRFLRDYWKLVDLTLVSYCRLPQSTLLNRPYSNSSIPSA
jgi:hypothetical protein